MDKMKLYNALPIWAQNIACDFEGYRIEKSRYPKNFDTILEDFLSRDNMNLSEAKMFQVGKLKKLLIHCQENVPYYMELFKKIGFNAYEFNDLEQMKQIPILTKAEVNKDYNKFITQGVKEKDCLVIYTGGTTGCLLYTSPSPRD